MTPSAAGHGGTRDGGMQLLLGRLPALLLLGLAGRGAWGWELVLEKAEDFVCTGGAGFIFKGPGGLAKPNMRSGFPKQVGCECVAVTPAPVAKITRVELDYRYVVGYSAGQSPVLSVKVTADPKTAPGGAGVGRPAGVSVYTAPAADGKYPYDGCKEKDKMDCYSPPVSVDADCPTCAAGQLFVAFSFDNHDRNMQLLLPITIRVNELINPHNWGWDIILLLSLSVAIFVSAGSLWNAKGRGRRGWDMLPAVKEVKQLAGLVRDGVGFSVALARGQLQAMPGPKNDGGKDGPVASLLGGKGGGGGGLGVPGAQAGQGRPSVLHHAASLGTAPKLRGLLADSGGPAVAALNAGDERRCTAFHIACAGGHVDCVRMLLEAGCDTALCNYSGLTGWELAEQLHRSEVLALRGPDTTASLTGGSVSSGGSRSKKGKKKDRRSSSKDKRLGGSDGKTVDEGGPIKVVAANGMESIML